MTSDHIVLLPRTFEISRENNHFNTMVAQYAALDPASLEI